MSARRRLRVSGRRLVCRLLGHKWGVWEYTVAAGSRGRYRLCLRCPAVDWPAWKTDR